MQTIERSPKLNTKRRPKRPEPEGRLLKAFGRRLASARLARGLSQKAIAQELAIGDELLSKYERGLHLPKLGTLLKLRALLSASLDHLLAGVPSAGIADPRLLRLARAASQLPSEQRDLIACALETMVATARAAAGGERPAGGGG